jgi:DNA-binding transcriptional MerR regulator
MNERMDIKDEVSLTMAARLARISPARVREAVRIGLVRPYRSEGSVVWFRESDLGRLRRIRRLREDLGLNTAGVEVVLHLLDEIEALRRARPTSPLNVIQTESGGATWHSR